MPAPVRGSRSFLINCFRRSEELRLVCVRDYQSLFVKEIGVNQRLDQVTSGFRERHVNKETDVVGKAARCDLKSSRLRDNDRLLPVEVRGYALRRDNFPALASGSQSQT
jgi:hypothetical protein